MVISTRKLKKILSFSFTVLLTEIVTSMKSNEKNYIAITKHKLENYQRPILYIVMVISPLL